MHNQKIIPNYVTDRNTLLKMELLQNDIYKLDNIILNLDDPTFDYINNNVKSLYDLKTLVPSNKSYFMQLLPVYFNDFLKQRDTKCVIDIYNMEYANISILFDKLEKDIYTDILSICIRFFDETITEKFMVNKLDNAIEYKIILKVIDNITLLNNYDSIIINYY